MFVGVCFVGASCGVYEGAGVFVCGAGFVGVLAGLV